MSRVYPSSHSRGGETERLIKQTYSVHVFLPTDRPHGVTRKWHLSEPCHLHSLQIDSYPFEAAYFSQSKLDSLQTIDNIRGVGDVLVPDGWFRSARATKARRDNREISGGPSSPSGDAAVDPPEPIDSFSHRLPSQSRRSHLPPYSEPTSRQELRPSPKAMATRSKSSSPPSGLSQLAPGGQLVPLEYLQSISYPRRDPTDEQLLRKFTMQNY